MWGVLVLLLRQCESPLEQAMVCALFVEAERLACLVLYKVPQDRDIVYVHGRHVWMEDVPMDMLCPPTGFGPSTAVLVIEPQQTVHPYRVDFLLRFTYSVQGDRSSQELVIECDGHDYHERTKEQARAD